MATVIYWHGLQQVNKQWLIVNECFDEWIISHMICIFGHYSLKIIVWDLGVKLDIHIEKLDIGNHKEMTLKSIFIHILICQN